MSGRRSWRSAAALALLAALLVPGAAASAGDLTVRRIGVPPEAVVEGPGRVASFVSPADAGATSLLAVAGETLVLELDTAWANRTAAGVILDRGQATRRDEFRDGTFHATTFREGHSVFLVDVGARDAPILRLGGAPASLEPTAAGVVEQHDRTTEGHPLRSVQVGGTVAWRPEPGWTTLSARGDFYLTLWEMDGEAADGVHRASYTTGERADGPGSGVVPPALAVGRVEDRELHLFAYNATLEWRFRTPQRLSDQAGGEPDELLKVHLAGASVESPVPVVLPGATGTLRGNGARLDVQGQEVRMAAGRLDSVQVAGTALAVSLTAADDALAVDGQPIVWPAPEPPVPRWGLALAGIALAAALLLAWRLSGSGLRRLARAMEADRYADVVARRGRGRIPARHAPRASVLHAVSLLALRRHDEAGAFLESLPAAERPEAPTLCYLLAVVRAGQGRTAEAGRLLRDCLAAAPEYLREAVANPTLLPLLQRSDVPRPLQGAGGE